MYVRRARTCCVRVYFRARTCESPYARVCLCTCDDGRVAEERIDGPERAGCAASGWKGRGGGAGERKERGQSGGENDSELVS